MKKKTHKILRRWWQLYLRPPNPKLLRICCTHHKTGTVLFSKILRGVSNRFHLQFQGCEQNSLKGLTDIWLEDHSQVDFDEIYRPYKGVHVIRDPRDVVISGFFHHLRCSETWCLKPQRKLQGKSYQQHLRGLSQEDGIIFEMTHTAKWTIRSMERWNYQNPNMLEVKYEEILKNYQEQFHRVFTFFGFRKEMLDTCMTIAELHNINNYSEEGIKKMAHVHSKELNKWRTYFTEENKRLAKELYGDALIALGYEQDTNW